MGEGKNIKVILSGLDNAGKSSMLIAIKKMYDFEEEARNLKPTIRIDYFRREFLSYKLNFFDMGGQQKFREMYIKKPIYFESVDLLIYLIDIQDEDRFTESVEYLTKVLDILKENGYSRERAIYLCFSKSDYELFKSHAIEFADRIQMLANLLTTTCPDFKFMFYQTSIFTTYSIMRMISYGLRNMMDFHAIDQKFSKFLIQHKQNYGILFDHTGIALSEHFIAQINMLDLEEQVNQMISGHLEEFGRLEEEKLHIKSNRIINQEFTTICYQFQIPDHPQNFYLALQGGHTSPKIQDSEIDSLLEDLKELLKKDFF
jgi:hypothetical protein